MRFRFKLAIAAVAVNLAACGGGGGGTTGPSTPGGTTTPPPSTTPSAPVQTNAVTVQDNSFSPANIQVSPGTTVTWSWPTGTNTHNVTFNDGVSSGDKASGQTYSRTFSAAGTFSYVCTLHGGMTGSVLVK